MNMYLNCAQLKDNAKEKLSGKYGFLIGVYMIATLISSQASNLILSQIPKVNLAGIVLSEAVTFLVLIFTGVLAVGIIYILMKIDCGAPTSLSDIFYGFTHNLQTLLGISLAIESITFIFYLSYRIPIIIAIYTGQLSKLILIIPFVIITVIGLLPISLSLSQSYFLALDFPDKTAKEILSLSMRIMKGQKVRLFLIRLSFIPLQILASLSLIGHLWLNPYQNMTYTQFYFDIMKPVQKD